MSWGGDGMRCLWELLMSEREVLERKMVLKYALDRGVALAFLPLLLGVTVLVQMATWLEAVLDPVTGGPIFYREERWTQGRSFIIFKYRTACCGTQQPGELGHLTRVGVLLKKWYLDELPQVLNILKGDMTLVGPRPNGPGKARREIEEEGMEGKMLLRAGLTGLVQVHKRAAQDRACYRQLEEAYLTEMRRRSSVGVLLYDIELLGRTIPMMLRGEGL